MQLNSIFLKTDCRLLPKSVSSFSSIPFPFFSKPTLCSCQHNLHHSNGKLLRGTCLTFVNASVFHWKYFQLRRGVLGRQRKYFETEGEKQAFRGDPAGRHGPTGRSVKGDRLQDQGGDEACRGPHLGGWKKRGREGSWLLAGGCCAAGWICGAPVVVAEGEETALRSAPSVFLHGERLQKASLMVWRGHRKRTGSWAWSWHSDRDGDTWCRFSKFQLMSGGHRGR